VIGRWTTPDPLAEFHPDITSYNYVLNNPVNLTDPFGLDTVKQTNKDPNAGNVGDQVQGAGDQYYTVNAAFGSNTPSATTDDNSSNNSAPTFNFDSQAAYLDKHSFSHYIPGKDKNGRSICGHCALHIRLSLEAGGLKTNDRPPSTGSARNYGPYLKIKGYTVVGSDGYMPKKGDIRVWQPYPGGDPNGHIDAYDGNQWVSDFKERSDGPGPGYRKNPDFEIYRRE
jgi:hypothetical protein